MNCQAPDFGGGEIWLDDVMIKSDGLFMLPELEPWNPASLIGWGIVEKAGVTELQRRDRQDSSR